MIPSCWNIFERLPSFTAYGVGQLVRRKNIDRDVLGHFIKDNNAIPIDLVLLAAEDLAIIGHFVERHGR
jgi:hypothetical protein